MVHYDECLEMHVGNKTCPEEKQQHLFFSPPSLPKALVDASLHGESLVERKGPVAVIQFPDNLSDLGKVGGGKAEGRDPFCAIHVIKNAPVK